jgi:hypothetical protein
MWNTNANLLSTTISGDDRICEASVTKGNDRINFSFQGYGEVVARLIGDEVYISITQYSTNGNPYTFAPIILHVVE